MPGIMKQHVTEPSFEQYEVFYNGQMGYHTIRIPSIIVTVKGTVLAFAEGRRNSGADNGDIDLLCRRSFDRGKTWDGIQIVFEEKGEITMGDPCPIVDTATGDIIVLFTRDNMQAFYTRSTDDGATFQNPVEITDAFKGFDFSFVRIAAGPVHGIQLKDGRLIAPIWLSDQSIEKSHGASFRSGVIFSDDHGKSWQAGGLAHPGFDRLNECTVAEAGDDSLYLNSRAQFLGYRIVTRSYDRGLTWTRPGVDMNLPDPTCQGSCLALPAHEGKSLFLFSNLAVHGTGTKYDPKTRHDLTVRLSYDDGHTWPVSKLITQGPSGYSDLAFDSDFNIYLMYESGIKVYREKVTLVKFNLEWLTAVC